MKQKQNPKPKACITIKTSKYQATRGDLKQWWSKLIRILDHDAEIPTDRRLDILEKVFRKSTLEKVLEILGYDPIQFKDSVLRTLNMENYFDEGEPETTEPSVLGSSRQATLSEEDYISRMKTRDAYTYESYDEKKENPYLNFFKRPAERAAIWRTLPPLELEKMDLDQKAECVAEIIAVAFVKWLKEMGGIEEDSLDVPSVMKMFEIAFNTQAATSLKVCLREMPAITQQVAEASHLPHLDTRATLLREVKRDYKATKIKPKRVAFSKNLPQALQKNPLEAKYIKKWYHCDNVPKKLDTMAVVWEGITHLRSTTAFCSYLLDHPDIPPPKYLKERQLLDPQYLSIFQGYDSDISMSSRLKSELNKFSETYNP